MTTQFRTGIAILIGVAVFPMLATSVQAEPLDAVPAESAELTVSQSAEDLVAQQITPGRATRSGPSYIGVGGNIGFGGDTAMGRGNFTIYSKIGLTSRFSARPGLVVGGDPTILLPLTADFPIAPVAENVDFAVAPFVGGGLAISTGSDSLTRPLITGGIDVPVADRVTLTAQGNVAFFRDTEGSVILGVGYNF
ncbi:MAG: hypothetical protein KME07_07055 [Pegethrix bostrychoides GSE-TBD4-15B]|jgi:hypothetical protein|uniref:Outer membrane protein beta-barrel domain-containing protein n=1 Tax=Pegethrix bostrychoides GSE-TBD4-15B TaxID=2839662 RepID=A0A951P8S8_9CYAN|nr:hypothetical protein [Pegethrix bostrychoides GSE-TBD4-15B]